MAKMSWDSVGLATVGFLGVLGVRRRLEAPKPAEKAATPLRLPGAQCIVTGASGGLGAELALALAEAGAEVTLGCRSLERCERQKRQLFARCNEAAEKERKEVLPSATSAGARSERRRHCLDLRRRMVCKELDLNSARSIRAFAKEMAGSGSRQIILVNNAGVMGESTEDTDDVQLRTNHYGHFMLTQLLLPKMDPSSIIVVMTSRAHRQGSLTVGNEGETLNSEEIEGSPPVAKLLHSLGLGWYARYARSKLCNVLFAAEQRRRLPEGPAVVAVSPGLVNTDIFRSVSPEALGRLVRWLADKFFQTPSEGAQNVLAALQAAHEAQAKGESEEVALYWHCGQPQRPSEASLHPGLGAALWRASEAAVKEF
ncbi:unnamed protein product [Effrenium voratum]|uniref:Uncharacterized protein n=1 Tax=Effrenium voratum TaxID=2562239 RepID=A0AA36NGD4_9DINO|nr:unnamed protein product [Effrenium voratum]CAJ1439692.1 unnamed protein product [Effrenium voratum]